MRDLRRSSGDSVITIDDEEADRVLSALSADSAREILGVLNERPATVSELAEVTSLTPQNVSYHLGKLEEAELVEPVDRTESGNGATVYAPARSITVSTETDGSRRRYPVNAVGILVGGLLTLVCLLGIVDPHVDQLAIVGYGLGLLKFA
jgi:DNA-binding transcriptional ArsR family regulator